MTSERRNATSSPALTPPLKWHIDGGKQYLASRIVALFPPRCKKPNNPAPGDPGWLHYVEPYAGGLAVLFANNPEGVSEVVNDLNMDLSNFWGVLQNQPLFDVFVRCCQAMPFSEAEFDASEEALRNDDPDIAYTLATGIDDPRFATSVARAVAFFIRCRQSLAGRMDAFAALSRTRTRRGMNEQASAWLNAVEGLPAVHARLKRVVILNRDALDVIHQQDGEHTLFYLDPPYLHETRATIGEYAHEMSRDDHERLLILLQSIKGKFLLSGYRSELYDAYAKVMGWNRVDFDLPNNAAGGQAKRRMTECVWCNFEASE